MTTPSPSTSLLLLSSSNKKMIVICFPRAHRHLSSYVIVCHHHHSRLSSLVITIDDNSLSPSSSHIVIIVMLPIRHPHAPPPPTPPTPAVQLSRESNSCQQLEKLLYLNHCTNEDVQMMMRVHSFTLNSSLTPIHHHSSHWSVRGIPMCSLVSRRSDSS